MKTIKSIDYISAINCQISFNLLFLTLTLPFTAALYINQLGFTPETIINLLSNYGIAYIIAGYLGGALQGSLFALGYNYLASSLGPIKAEFYEEGEINEDTTFFTLF